jgi:hypothetical protein
MLWLFLKNTGAFKREVETEVGCYLSSNVQDHMTDHMIS